MAEYNAHYRSVAEQNAARYERWYEEERQKNANLRVEVKRLRWVFVKAQRAEEVMRTMVSLEEYRDNHALSLSQRALHAALMAVEDAEEAGGI